jgi:APA family basic amino acid/polyamine antiporter
MTLKRVLGPLDVTWLVAGNMIGAGIFFTPGLVSGYLPGGFWPLVAWALGGLLALCGAAVYAELGGRLPKAGGDYQYLSEAFGPAWGFLSGWAALLLTFSAAAAAASIVATRYLQTALPALEAVPVWAVSPIFVMLLTVANVTGARFAGRMTAVFTAIPVAGLLLLFGGGLAGGNVEVRWPTMAESTAEGGLVAFGVALLPIYFTYAGWNAAAYLAGELRDPARGLARGLLGGTATVGLLYLAINAVFLLVIPQEQLAGSTTAGADAARLLLGPLAERALALFIAVAVLGSANVTLMAGARINYAMAVDGLLPRPLARTNDAGVPATALWAGGVWAALLSLFQEVETLVNWASLAIVLMSSMVVIALFILRRREYGEPGYRCTGYPFTPLFYLVIALAVACASSWVFPRQSLYGVLIVAAGFPVYRWVARSPRVSSLQGSGT